MRFVYLAVLCCFSVPAFCYDNGIVPVNTPESAKRLITDLIENCGDKYPQGAEFLKRLESIAPNDQTKLDALIREAALANPLLNFDKILCIRRKPHEKKSRGFTMLNAYTEDTIPRKGWDNEIVLLSNLRTEPKLTTVYRHNNDGILRDIDLHFNADKVLFASVNDKGNWAVFEAGLDGNNVRELTPNDQNDIQWFDPCYLAEEGAILSFSTAGMQGVPCVAGSQKVASLYRIDEAKEHQKQKIRQLTFEQDSGWHPRLLNDGRVMYLRWQYTETPHYFDRMLFTMAPDGRQQRALWGSGAFFPAAYKFARPVPAHPSMVLGVVSGHHSLPETGRLMLVDPNLGTHYPFRHDPKTKEWGVPGTHADIYPRVYPKEVTGCVQEIPGWGRDVIGNVYDNQGGDCKYTFATPFPLNEKYFLVSMWLSHEGTWGIWLVDVFDNMVKLHDLPDAGLYEPIPLIPRQRPPVRPDLTVAGEKEGTMFISDIYEGRGLTGVASGEWQVASNNEWLIVNNQTLCNYEHFKVVSGLNSLAEINHLDKKDLLLYAAISERGDVRNRIANAESSGVHRQQHSGGTGTQFDRGVSPVSGDFQRFFVRVGDAVNRLTGSGVSPERGIGEFVKRLRRDKQVAQWLDEILEIEKTRHSPLAARHSIPRGKAKSLRVFAYHWAYWGTGNYTAMGEYSGYDIKRILGTVPIEEDGSVSFKVPANTPVAFHVLDEDGAAIQLMQSWTIAMPGENVSCVGCHEKTNDVVPPKNAIASRKPPQEITPFYGAARPYGFQTEIQPVLDRYCVQCHNDTNKQATGILSFAANDNHRNPVSRWQDNTPYKSLHPFVRRPGTESDIATKTPMDYHVSTSELVQRLRRGHYGVQLDKESQDKLYTWIDLNVPYRAAWNSPANEARRLELQKLYAGLDDDPEDEIRNLYNNAVKNIPRPEIKPVPPEEINKLLKHNDDGSGHFKASIGPLPAVKGDNVKAQGFPFAYTEAKRRQNDLQRKPMTVSGIKFVPIPAGEFVMGSVDGFDDERPRAAVKIEKPFWIAETEITNGQYAHFDAQHDTGYEGEHGYDHISPGYIANHHDQPVARVSWQEAMAFCDWLTKKAASGELQVVSGEAKLQNSPLAPHPSLHITLPTEAQWEWAARAGTDQAFFFGHRFADFSYYANLADAGLRKTYQSHEGYEWDGHDRRRPPNFLAQAGSSLIKQRRYFHLHSLFPLRDDRFADKWFTVDYVKQYEANPWNLYDVIGNVWEWTLSDYAPYPYNGNDGRNDGGLAKKKVVRGGSHSDRSKVIGSAVRVPYETYQKVHNVGFRPIIVTE